jgi:type II secretory pathway component PulM
MDALPLAGNLSLYELFRQVVPNTALGAVAVVLTMGLFLSLVAMWLWYWRPDENLEGKASTMADIADSMVAERGSSLADTQVNRKS